MKKVISAGRASILSAVLTSACCLPALILLVFSVSSITLGATLAKYHWWFLGAGSILLVYSYVLYFRERCACPTGASARPHQWLTVVSLAIGTIVVIGLGASSVFPVFFRGERVSPARASIPDTSSVAITIPVEGMTCFSCELHVKKVLGAMPGVKQAYASATAGTVEVTFDPEKVMPVDLVQVINSKTGYKAITSGTADAIMSTEPIPQERERQ